MITKKDYVIGALAGFMTGLLGTLIFRYLNVNFSYKLPILLIGVPLLWALGVWLGNFLSRYFPFFAQFGKFAVVGFLSTSIDFTILNMVSSATGVTAGIVIGWINIPGFLVATLNGYLWNKLWVFKTPSGKTPGVTETSRNLASEISLAPSRTKSGLNSGTARPHLEISSARFRLFSDFPKFLTVTVIGLLINSGIIVLLTTYIVPSFEIRPQLWLNIAKVMATAVALVWNFVGYRLIVFTK